MAKVSDEGVEKLLRERDELKAERDELERLRKIVAEDHPETHSMWVNLIANTKKDSEGNYL